MLANVIFSQAKANFIGVLFLVLTVSISPAFDLGEYDPSSLLPTLAHDNDAVNAVIISSRPVLASHNPKIRG